MRLQDVEDFFPLTPLQQGLLFHSLSDPTSRMYFNQTRATLRGDLDVDAFREAWQTVVDTHPILRTFFVWEGVERPIQVVKQKAVMPFEVRDWRGLSAQEREARFDALRLEDLERGFDLSRAPLMRAVLLRTADDSHDLFWSFHHILMDGWSMFHVLRHVFDSYDALRTGAKPSLVSPRPFRDYLVWLERQSLPRAEAFWRRALGGFTAPTPLPYEAAPADGALRDDSEDASGDDREDFAALATDVSAETTAALQALSQKHRVTLNTILQGAWALLLARTSREDDVVFGAVVSGRPADLDGVESMVGLFINSLPVRVRVPGHEPVVDWLRRVQAEQAELREYEYSPLVEIQNWSEVPRGAPLFDSIFLFENYHKDVPLEEMSRTLEIGDVRWFERHNYPIAALAAPGAAYGARESTLTLRIIYQTRRFSAATIERMLAHWRTLLDGIAADPSASPADLPLLTEAEREQIVVEWNRTRTDYPRDRCIHELLEEQVRRSPDAVAVTFEDQRLTYRELNARANRLAHHLRGLGVGPEVQVGICMERSLELVVAILGILKAGGAYVSLDPDYPAERLAFMLEETRTPVLLTQDRLAAALAAHGTAHGAAHGTGPRLIRLDTEWDSIAGESDEDLPCVTLPGSLAYVIYTSGSTGRPKGTCIPHRAVVRLVRNTNFADFGADQVFLQFATVSFDASTLELWGPLLNGARLVVFPATTPSLEELGQVIQREGVTTLWLTAGLFHQMIERHPEGLRGVRQLLAGGDVLSVPHVRQALDRLEGCTLINGYGPTENTTFTCCHPMTRANPPGRSVPIGRPIANTTVYLLDRGLRPVPVGVIGDLYTGGDGVARGYLGHPALTAERFVPDPFGSEPGARLYRTGDQARYLPDGTIEFLGRDDFQVKVRGFRIELGEIEVALGRHPAVRDTVVMAREDAPGDKRLVAYVVCGEEAPSAGELRGFLKETLPDYMLPSAFVTLDSFPLTSNGKVDRRALPAPEGARPELETAYAGPTADVERTIAGIWQETLKLQKVGIHDNFFDLGGHSLNLIQVHGKLKAALQREIPMVDLFRFPTVSSLARHLGEGGAAEPSDAPEPEKVQAGKDRLSQLQARRLRSSRGG